MEAHPTTLDESASVHQPAATRGLTVTILWHSDLRRVGRISSTTVVHGTALDLQRTAPVFDDGAPLDDPRVSRSPLQVISAADGSAKLWPGRDGLRYTVDGARGVGGEVLPADRLARGVVLAFGRRGPLVLLESGLRQADPVRYGLVGPSEALTRVRGAIDLLAPRSCSVLILGPTGTGKELIARALHAHSNRPRLRYVAVNMAAFANGTAQSQLFGHRKGAFTGADRNSAGLFGDHDGGTVFLDEIGASTTDVQALLLRALESGEVQPVGGRPTTVDVRLIAATDELLDDAVQTGRFRRALLHRLAHGTITVPPLADRPADIATQLVAFLRGALLSMGAEERLAPGRDWLPRELVESVLRMPWSGNSRELRAFADNLAFQHANDARCDVPASAASVVSPPPEVTPLSELEGALAACAWRIDAAARMLGVHRNTLRRRMAEAGLPRPGQLTSDQIEQARAAADGDPGAAARALRVSVRGLRLRTTQLGLPPW